MSEQEHHLELEERLSAQGSSAGETKACKLCNSLPLLDRYVKGKSWAIRVYGMVSWDVLLMSFGRRVGT